MYEVPLVRPLTTHEEAFAAALHLIPPGEDITVKPVSAAPPLFVGAVNETVAAPAVVTDADTDVGGPGRVAGVTAKEGVDGFDVKTPLLAVATKVYAVPFVRPETMHVRAGALTWQVPAVLPELSFAVTV